MARYGIVCDVSKCCGCFSCFMSCKDEHIGNDYLPLTKSQSEGQDWIRVKEIEYGQNSKPKIDYLPIMCQHCEDPACASKAPEGAVYRRDDGVVIIDPEKAKGAKEIVNACPYNCISWNEELQLPQKCTLCMHMIEKGEKKPRCVECCPTLALVFGDMDDPESEISKLIAEKKDRLEVFKPEFGTKPTMRYIALPKPFIAGALRIDGECAEGVEVSLTCIGCSEKRTVKSNFLGDFEFKSLKLGEDYTISVCLPGRVPVEQAVHLNASTDIGTIKLEKA